MMATRKRADVLVVEQRLASTREKAKSLILSGVVLNGDVVIQKPGDLIAEGATLRLKSDALKEYVSRSARKLKSAVEELRVDVEQKICLDVGASTGGFTEILLEKGAQKIFAVDVGTNQLDWKIRSDPRVICHEGVNARYIEYNLINQKVDLIVMDVSFISVKQIIPSVRIFSRPGTEWIILIKPQFEVGKELVGKGGIVADERLHKKVTEEIKQFCENLGLKCNALIKSAVKGTKGNQEYFVWLTTNE